MIENVGGAGGTLGANKVAKAAPDGYTLLLYHVGMATSPALYRNLPYKTLDDFEYLGMINDVPMTLIGRPTLPANNYRRTASSGSKPTRARSTWPTPAWARPRTCAGCCSSRPSRST